MISGGRSLVLCGLCRILLSSCLLFGKFLRCLLDHFVSFLCCPLLGGLLEFLLSLLLPALLYLQCKRLLLPFNSVPLLPSLLLCLLHLDSSSLLLQLFPLSLQQLLLTSKLFLFPELGLSLFFQEGLVGLVEVVQGLDQGFAVLFHFLLLLALSQ